MISIPGWTSVETAARLHRGFEIAGFVALGLLLLFEVLAYIYGNRRDELAMAREQAASVQRRQQQEEGEKQRKQEDERRNSEIAAANQRAVEAQAIAEQVKQRAAPRVLSPIERHKISAFLVGKPIGAFVIKASLAADDARNYGEQIADVFKAAGWTVTIDNAMFMGPNVTGIWITVKDDNGTGATVGGLLQQAFAAGGIAARGQLDATINPTDVWLSIGAK